MWIFPLNMVIFHSYVNVYQRVSSLSKIVLWCRASPTHVHQRFHHLAFFLVSGSGSHCCSPKNSHRMLLECRPSLQILGFCGFSLDTLDTPFDSLPARWYLVELPWMRPASNVTFFLQRRPDQHGINNKPKVIWNNLNMGQLIHI